MRYQVDYINALVETRKSTDVFTKRLKSLNDTTVTAAVKVQKQKSLFKLVKDSVSSRLGLNLSSTLGADESDADEITPPTVFCYSLIYVYYDQYTYITGVLAQDVLLGIVAVYLSIQVSSNIFSNFLYRSSRQFKFQYSSPYAFSWCSSS